MLATAAIFFHHRTITAGHELQHPLAPQDRRQAHAPGNAQTGEHKTEGLSTLAKHASHDPTAVPAQAALDLATIGGARALGIDRLIGSLEVGKRADVITVSMGAARQTPLYDPVSHLVYVTRGDDVRTTVVNGRVLMRNRKVLTVDETAVTAEARSWAEKVRAAVKLPATGR